MVTDTGGILVGAIGHPAGMHDRGGTPTLPRPIAPTIRRPGRNRRLAKDFEAIAVAARAGLTAASAGFFTRRFDVM